MTTENENQEPANSPVHTYAANLSALLCQGIRETLKQADSAHARCLVVSALESELTKLRKIVRPAFEVEVARRSLDRLEANYRVIKQGKPELEDIQTWDGIIRSAQRKLAKAETELSRTPPLV